MAVDLGRELALPFEQLIGAPLQSVVKAGAMAGSSTADFIQSVGLQSGEDGRSTARTVDFSFKRPSSDGAGAVGQDVELSVPLLTMVPIPYLQLKRTQLDFEVKIESTTVEQQDTDAAADAGASGGFWGVSASFKATYESKSAQDDTTNRSATLGVHVEAVQDDMPAGLQRVLNLLESAITDSPQPQK
ncbi:hypothetical protein BTM25_10080 [Actinomadura rubteroloni]|uniref:DUF2589 domain-containing protein n=1 Tax=Actinomadura rubteroloni TaxID=1926885 RepID=A0A2P4UNI9_9ACTN|nr:DUF2589 domain-containing protein [Actinomadura rubteroloni]POM26606.1 hypothetical protein BTM25_10080 [Actinomadura rubteroloni]